LSENASTRTAAELFVIKDYELCEGSSRPE